MKTASNDMTQLAVSVANRLRLLQVHLADYDETERRKLLAELVEETLRGTLADQREPLLRMLGEHFPTWDKQVRLTEDDANQRGATVSTHDERELQDPAFLVERLLAVYPTLDTTQQEAITHRLAKAGISIRTAGGVSSKSIDQLKAKCHLPDKATIDPTRAVEACAALIELIHRLDRTAWLTWQKLHPKSRRSPNLVQILGQYMSGMPGRSAAEVGTEIDRTRQLVVAMIAAVGTIGAAWATRYEQTLSPRAIRSGTMTSIFQSKEAAYWQQYEKIAGGMDIDVIAHEMRKEIETIILRLAPELD